MKKELTYNRNKLTPGQVIPANARKKLPKGITIKVHPEGWEIVSIRGHQLSVWNWKDKEQ